MSPYKDLPSRNFWKTGVDRQHPLLIEDLYRKKFPISPATRIATAGSCFAQHIARHMSAQGFNVLDVEPPPPTLDLETAKRFGYRLYSARYANIYVIRQLKQLLKEALGEFTPRDIVWERNGRLYDALRPSVEPLGLNTAEEVQVLRKAHLKAVRSLLDRVDLLIFTFGLVETWIHTESGTVYPTAPGTIAGQYDPAKHSLRVFKHSEILEDFVEVRAIVKRFNPGAQFLVTVSPVPLTATACDMHVLQATTNAKSTLRSVAGQLYSEFDDVDYFPSYELIASPFSRGFFYESNLREVSEAGVDAVMRVFFNEHGESKRRGAAVEAVAQFDDDEDDESLDRKARRLRRRKAPVGVGLAAKDADDSRRSRRLRRQQARKLGTGLDQKDKESRLARRLRRQQKRGAVAMQTAAPTAGQSTSAVCEEMLLDAFARK